MIRSAGDIIRVGRHPEQHNSARFFFTPPKRKPSCPHYNPNAVAPFYNVKGDNQTLSDFSGSTAPSCTVDSPILLHGVTATLV